VRCRSAHLIVSLLVCLAGCGLKTTPVRRLAVLPFDNQTGDPRLDWMQQAFPIAIADSLDHVQGMEVFRADSASGAAAAQPDHFLYGYLTGGVSGVTVHYSLEEAATRKFSRSDTLSAGREDRMLAAAGQLASQFASAPQSPATASVGAFHAYVDGLSATDAAAAAAAFEDAVAKDPKFGDAWMKWAAQTALRGDTAKALNILERFKATGPKLGPLPQARLEILDADLRHDSDGKRKAQVALAAALPRDLSAQIGAASACVARSDFPCAIDLYRKALTLAPQNADLWNSIAYAQAWSGDQDDATRSLGEYRKVSHDAPNAIDSEGEIDYWFGHFEQAEKQFLACYAKDPAFLGGVSLRKAAESRLAMGDFDGAGKHMSRFLAQRKEAKDPLLEIHQALWEKRTGKIVDAMARLANVTRGPQKNVAALAAVLLGLWQLDAGEFERAKELVSEARALGMSQATSLVAALCLLGSGTDASAEEWSRRADSIFVSPALTRIKREALGITLVFHRRFADAIPVLKAVVADTEPGSDALPGELLAWSLLETGQLQESARLLKFWPIPPSQDVNLLASLVYSRAYYLRAWSAEKASSAQARQWYDLFLRLSPRTDRYGLIERARSAVSL
jgi:tetratricopeptide (TPR) repeat protein